MTQWQWPKELSFDSWISDEEVIQALRHMIHVHLPLECIRVLTRLQPATSFTHTVHFWPHLPTDMPHFHAWRTARREPSTWTAKEESRLTRVCVSLRYLAKMNSHWLAQLSMFQQAGWIAERARWRKQSDMSKRWQLAGLKSCRNWCINCLT